MGLVQEAGKPSGRQTLDEAEAGLREALAAADAAPFLGHYCLPDGIGEALRSELDRRHESLTKRLRLLFYLWPALTVTWIAGTVARRYGSMAQMELYPHLEHLLGSRIDPIGRRRTAELFRQACRRLDLPLPESAEPVDTYVVQAGVPVAQIEVLARAFLTAERREGLPDSDDDTAVAVFTHATIAALAAGIGLGLLKPVIGRHAFRLRLNQCYGHRLRARVDLDPKRVVHAAPVPPAWPAAYDFDCTCRLLTLDEFLGPAASMDGRVEELGARVSLVERHSGGSSIV